MTVENWFSASKKGLEKIARRRGLSYVLFELIQNAWDTGAKEVKVSFEVIEGRPLCEVTVEDDDPDGFKDLTHAWTLFAESEKKGDPEKRGRFNLGEKLVLAICESAEITSTKGNVRFDDAGRHVGRKRTERGSIFKGVVKMTREELRDIIVASRNLITPPGVVTIFRGERLPERTPLKEFEASLPTEVANEEGFLIPRIRKTKVRVYEACRRERDEVGETKPNGFLYEMGIPVCPTGDQWDVEIMQKIPVPLERDTVTDTYLRTVRVFVLNEMVEQLKPEDATSRAVQDALTDKRVHPEAVEKVLTYQFGEKRAVYDPSDPEANNRLVSEGYTLIPSRAFSRPAWDNIRSSGAALPSGKIRPTPHPYSDDPDAPQRVLIPEEEWTEGMRGIATYATDLAWKLIHQDINVVFDKGRFGSGWAAAFGSHELTFNMATLGKEWFNRGVNKEVNELLIHEFAHNKESNHLSDRFYKELQRLGAALTEIALKDPSFFKFHGWKESK